MADVTEILSRIERGDPQGAEELLPLVYAELRRLAAHKLAAEKPGQTLDPTALVHEAYLRLVPRSEAEGQGQWDGRGHFYAAAAEAMRRILVESARRKGRIKHGGEFARIASDDVEPAVTDPDDDVLAVHESLELLDQVDHQAAEVVKLHFFAALTLDEVATLLGISSRTAYRDWAFARAWLARKLGRSRD
ncbi:MAG TPA: ECF-type sigma factor [Gemmataceae bacterium]|nr:ECF-type sigma factor [Gemmataceae bacterium]